MADDRLWLCCRGCGVCTLLAKWGVSGVTESRDVGGFIDAHAGVVGPDRFVVESDAGVVLGRVVRWLGVESAP